MNIFFVCFQLGFHTKDQMRGQSEGLLKTKTVSSRTRSLVINLLFRRHVILRLYTISVMYVKFGFDRPFFLVVVVNTFIADSQTLASNELRMYQNCIVNKNVQTIPQSIVKTTL